MKKIVFMTLLLFCAVSFGQSTLYFDLGQFQGSAGPLVVEDFSGGPGGGSNICGNVISNTGDGCFLAGELAEGFSVTASNGTDVELLDVGTNTNQTINLVGANVQGEYVTIDFTDSVFGIGFILYNTQDEFTTVRTFGANGDIIDSVSVFTDVDTEFFFGVISSVPIGYIEIEGDDNSKGFFGSLYFTEQPDAGNGDSACEANTVSSNSFEAAFAYSTNSGQGIVNDITVAPSENFELEQIIYNSYHENGEEVVSVDVNFYAWAGGLPGVLIEGQTGVVPSSQTFLGSNGNFDISEIVLDITPVLFEGQESITTTYWVELINGNSSGGGDLFWEITTNELIGNPVVFHDPEFEIFSVDNEFSTADGVYTWVGECNDILSTVDSAMEDFGYYPNPVESVLNLTSLKQIETVEIYNLLGQNIISYEINELTTTIDVSDMASGAYLLKVRIDGELGIYKIIKE